ncbi:uncharacterized protein KY384_008036 [Bacidia gigantensis]|uniref:uncharacterized protein n=1 Tax=Bacidia gigantensis TaxID=2732470 RepID=UPI001D04A8F2|nr:uncharacterized protein KY384_008036 [Bacidia gigantensis]KAG8527292.1 hypothetical protein KY384_008036 [Bacidia gigantensis]
MDAMVCKDAAEASTRTMSAGFILRSFPQELVDKVMNHLTPNDFATIARLSRNNRDDIEPHLYKVFFTKTWHPHDTMGLVKLLTRRPEIIPMLRHLVFDEFHPQGLRLLFSILMPNLQSVHIAFREFIHCSLEEDEIKSLNEMIKPQTTLRKGSSQPYDFHDHVINERTVTIFCTRSACGWSDHLPQWDSSLLELKEQDLPLICHPNIENLHLFNIDVEAFTKAATKQPRYERLTTLSLEIVKFPSKLLDTWIQPSKLLRNVTITHIDCTTWPPENYFSGLAEKADMVEMLTLSWSQRCATKFSTSIDLKTFKALKLLVIYPLIPGSHSGSQNNNNLSLDIGDLITHQLPPHLEKLGFGLPRHRGEVMGIDGLRRLLKEILDHKTTVAPRLKELHVEELEHMLKYMLKWGENLTDIAKLRGVELVSLDTSTEQIGKNVKKWFAISDGISGGPSYRRLFRRLEWPSRRAQDKCEDDARYYEDYPSDSSSDWS